MISQNRMIKFISPNLENDKALHNHKELNGFLSFINASLRQENENVQKKREDKIQWHRLVE